MDEQNNGFMNEEENNDLINDNNDVVEENKEPINETSNGDVASESNDVIDEKDNVVESRVTKERGRGFFVVFLLLCVITIVFSALAIKNDISPKVNNDDESVGEIYSDIIKTMSKTAGNDEEFSIRDIATLTMNSVVEINTETVVWGSRLGQYISAGAGSGIIISSDGYIVTNNHVIDDATKITVKLNDGRSYDATIVGTYSESDIAVIKIEEKDLQPVVLGDSDKLFVGDTAVVVGNPLGSLGGSVTTGIISALDREIDLGDIKMNLLQTNAAVNPGNSGGGLFNGKAELVGIIIAKSAGEDIEGIGFAIPINDIKEDISELKMYGYKRGRVQLGVSLIDINDAFNAFMYKVDSTGVYIQSISDDSDAKKAGLKVGDRVVSIDGNEVKTSGDIKKTIQSKYPGDKVLVTVIRDGREKKINVELTEYKGQ